VGRLAPIRLSADEREILEDLGSSEDIHPRVAQRIRVVLLAAAGASNRAIAAATGMHYNRVGVWRRRYSTHGLAGLEDDERSGRPSVYGVDAAVTVMSIIGTPPPDSLPRWTVKLLADQMARVGIPISVSQLWRLCVGLDLLESGSSPWLLAKRRDQWVDRVEICAFGSAPRLRSIVFAVSDEPSAAPGRFAGPRFLAGSTGSDEAIASALLRVDVGRAVVSLAQLDTFAGTDALASYLDATSEAIGDSHIVYCVVSSEDDGPNALDEVASNRDGRGLVHRSSSHERWVNQARLVVAAQNHHLAVTDEERSPAPSKSLVELFTSHRHESLAFWWNQRLVPADSEALVGEPAEHRDAPAALYRRTAPAPSNPAHAGELVEAQYRPAQAS
jgi:transposase